jgi:ubiquinone/menaquinone biosynthesis C-methylase UbiE
MKFIDLQEARKIYKKGNNVTEFLKKKFFKTHNTSEIIEIAYDLQAGTYIKFAKSNIKYFDLYTKEQSRILDDHFTNNNSLLDVGTGELTTLTYLLNHMIKKPSNVFAFDLSWSRLIKGKKFFKKNIKNKKIKLSLFSADIEFIPLHSKCIDVIISNHALEPNGKNLPKLLNELFRVAKKKVILFEPSYELNSIKGKKRMDKLGYIKNISSVVKKLGGNLIDIIPMKQALNPLNPTACYVINPPRIRTKKINKVIFCTPGTDFLLKKDLDFYVSKEAGLAYPIFKGIPILKNSSNIIVTANV